MIPSPDQEGGGASPPPADQEVSENPDASQAATTTAGTPTPLGEPLVMARGVPAVLGGRLREALERVLELGPDLVLVAGVAAIAVRAAEPSTVAGARLELPDAVPDLLGGEIETQALADGKRLRVWLAGAARIEPAARYP